MAPLAWAAREYRFGYTVPKAMDDFIVKNKM
jgi:hypothetical protein